MELFKFMYYTKLDWFYTFGKENIKSLNLIKEKRSINIIRGLYSQFEDDKNDAH